MSDDSKQLSVAELLARNGQQGAASSGGGGRRRRSGRGISVAELTGDLPVIPASGGGGHSAHAAPEEPEYEPPAYQPPAPEPASYAPPNYAQPNYGQSDYGQSDYAQPDYAQPDYAPPMPEQQPSYSPMSGPISIYNPLAPYPEPAAGPTYQPPAEPLPAPGRSNLVMPGRAMPVSRHSAPPEAPAHDPLRDPLPELDPYSVAPYAAEPAVESPPRSGRRRRRADPDDDPTTEVRPLRDLDQPDPLGGHGNSSAGYAGRGANGYGRSEQPLAPKAEPSGGRAARRRAAEAAEAAEAEAPATAWAPPAPDPAPRPDYGAPAPGYPPEPEPDRRSSRGRGEGSLPAWSARRRKTPAPPNDSALEPGAISTAAWSLASQDQQLLSGQTVAGDLLRDGVERAEAERSSARDSKRGRSKRGVERAEVLDLDEGRTDVHAPYPDDDLRDVDLLDDDFRDDDLLDDDLEDDDLDTSGSYLSKFSPRRSRLARKAEDDVNRRQWMILGGQSAGAAIAGMLLFKGFERMWEMLPWVALALAMIVILGLVALVRILRRTDDILSTVIAVVVGIFVTLGPLAFLLSTN